MTNRQEVKKLAAYIEKATGGGVALTTYSPGDGVTRYRLGTSYDGLAHDYFGDRALVTALGAAEAYVMLRAYCAGASL
jgi:hypothetical protein